MNFAVKHEINKSFMREVSREIEIPVVDLIIKALNQISKKYHENTTILAVCPISISVVKSALRSAKVFNAPIEFVATLNQVDLDGGYTKWTQRDFVKVVKEEAERISFKGPVMIALDHGGPWLKDRHVTENWNLDEAMEGVKESLVASLTAGYDLLHIDATVDKTLEKGETIKIETIVERTLDLMEYIEDFRRARALPKISYEVGTEEVHGGFTSPDSFNKFLKDLKHGLSKRGLSDVWPCFIVGDVGTDLQTTIFDTVTARNLVNIARKYKSYIKGHYTDYIRNLQDYPKVGMGGANVGPEFSGAEFDSLEELLNIEEGLVKEGRITASSKFKHVLTKSITDSNRWKKWLLNSEKDKKFSQLPSYRRKWLLKTSSRYVWTEKAVTNARSKLYENLAINGINGEEIVLQWIDGVMKKYFACFNLKDSISKIEQELRRTKKPP